MQFFEFHLVGPGMSMVAQVPPLQLFVVIFGFGLDFIPTT